jgi:hypothetical protein
LRFSATSLRDDYERYGYASPIEVFTPEIAQSYGERFLAYWNSFDAEVRRKPRAEQAFIYEQTHLVLPWVLDMAREPVVLDVVEKLLGPDILLWLAQWFVKLPGEDGIANGLVDWHQDEAYWGFDEPLVVTVSIACSPVTPENGAMRIVRGSHHGPLLPYEEGDTRSGNVLSRGQRIAGIDPSTAVDVVLTPGQMSVHHPRAVHASGPNRSAIPRINLVARFAAPSIRQAGPNPPEGILVRGSDGHGVWRLLDDPTAEGSPGRQLETLRRIKQNTAVVAAARAKERSGVPSG